MTHATPQHCIDALRDLNARYNIKESSGAAGFSPIKVQDRTETVILDGQEVDLHTAATLLHVSQTALFFRLYRRGKLGTKPDLHAVGADVPAYKADWRKVVLDGQEVQITDAAKRLGISHRLLYQRIQRKGLIGTKPDLRAIRVTQPPRRRH
jgi:DNA-binding NtrC family response regulator